MLPKKHKDHYHCKEKFLCQPRFNCFNKQYYRFTHLAISVSLDHHGDNNVTAAGGISAVLWGFFYENLYDTLYQYAGLLPAPLGSSRNFLTSVVTKSHKLFYLSLLNPFLSLLKLKMLRVSGVCVADVTGSSLL